jgi:hypothetical protein
MPCQVLYSYYEWKEQKETFNNYICSDIVTMT